MRLVRFHYLQGDAWGVVSGTEVQLLQGSPYGDWSPEGVSFPLEGLELLPPCNPGKIVCVGLNYRDHAKEVGSPLPEEPLLFLKPPSARLVTGSGSSIRTAANRWITRPNWRW